MAMLRWFLALPFRLLFSVLKLLSAPTIARAKSADDAAAIYIRELEEKYGQSHVPLLDKSYTTAIEKAKKELRFLMVILTSEVHDDTPAMQRLLCDDTLRNYALDKNLLVWAGSVTEIEAYKVSSSLGASRYPYIGLIVYNTLRGSTMSCVSKIEGIPTAIDLMTHLQESLDKYGPTLISMKAERREQTYSREIRAEQDSAYEASLRKDRERAEIARKKREEKGRVEREIREREENMLAWRQWKASTLLPEPTEHKNVSRISFRMPDGSRCVRKFASDSAIEDIYVWVDLQLNPVEDVSSVPPRPMDNFKHTFGFTLAVPMPRQMIGASDQALRERKEIYPSGSLIVELLDIE